VTRSRAKSSAGLDRLYAALPADFVRTRQAIARELTESGDARRAAEIKRLRRPTVPVWALNQVARRDAATLTAFVDAVQALRKAQRGGAGVPAAMKAERDARQRVVDRAEAAIAEASLRATPDVARRMSNTLLAAATDDESRGRLVAGTLDEELTPAGFELFEGARPVPPRRPGAPKHDVKALEAARKAEEQAQELDRASSRRVRAARSSSWRMLRGRC